MAILTLVDAWKHALTDKAILLLNFEPPANATIDPHPATITIEQLLFYDGGWDSAASVEPQFQLIALYASDAANWTQLPWIDRYSGNQVQVSTIEADEGRQRARLQSLRDVVQEFQTHPEAKSAGINGLACSRRTVGLLGRREVRETYVSHIGKEAKKLKEV